MSRIILKLSDILSIIVVKLTKIINPKELLQKKELIKPESLDEHLTSVEVILKGLKEERKPGNVPRDPRVGQMYTRSHDITHILVEHEVIKEFKFTGKLDELSKNELRRDDKLIIYFYPVDEPYKHIRKLEACLEPNIYRKMEILREIEGYCLRDFKETEKAVKIEKINDGKRIPIYP